MKEKHKTYREIFTPWASQILTCSPIPKMKNTFLKRYSATNNDAINRNMDQFHKKANESHYSKSYCCCHGNLLEFFFIRFGASFNQPNRVLQKLPTWLNELHYLIHDVRHPLASQRLAGGFLTTAPPGKSSIYFYQETRAFPAPISHFLRTTVSTLLVDY